RQRVLDHREARVQRTVFDDVARHLRIEGAEELPAEPERARHRSDAGREGPRDDRGERESAGEPRLARGRALVPHDFARFILARVTRRQTTNLAALLGLFVALADCAEAVSRANGDAR